MKYINAATNQVLDEADIAKSEIYRMLHKREKEAFIEYTNSMISCVSSEGYFELWFQTVHQSMVEETE